MNPTFCSELWASSILFLSEQVIVLLTDVASANPTIK
jgi:hypothetical protein